MLSVAILTTFSLVVLGILIYAVSVYNNLVRLSRSVDQSFGNIDVLLKQRRDEIPKLVDTCRAYMTHERDLLEDITRLRASHAEARTTDEKIQIENEISRALGRLRISVEAYPNLKANQNAIHIQSRITDLESGIADRRELFNETVTRHNIYIGQFPPLLVARSFGYGERPLLRIPDEEKVDNPRPFSGP